MLITYTVKIGQRKVLTAIHPDSSTQDLQDKDWVALTAPFCYLSLPFHLLLWHFPLNEVTGEGTGDLPAANSPTRTIDSVWKLFSADTWGIFAMEELKRMWHELLYPVLQVLFMLPAQKHLGLTVDHTLQEEHFFQKALGLPTAQTPSQK